MNRAPAIRIGVEFHPHIMGGTENFLRRLFCYLDPMFTVVAIGSARGIWQEALPGVETHVVPYLLDNETPADVVGQIRALGLDLIQSTSFSPVLALAAAQCAIPHLWRLGGHVEAVTRTPRERQHLLAIVKMTAQRTVCPSHYLRSQLDPIDPVVNQVIYNGIDLTELPVPSQAPAAASGHVAMLAHFIPTKRHDVFLHAARLVANRLPTVRFSLFGDHYPTAEMGAYAASLHTLVRTLGLTDVVEIRPLGRERFATLQAVDVVAFPGIFEGASNAILEMMGLGRAVVAAASGGNAELIEDGVSGVLVPPDDPQCLATTLLELLRSPKRLTALGAAARRRIETHFDITRSAREYAHLYRDTLGMSRAGS